MKKFLLTIALILFAGQAWGATKYVNNLGTDDAGHGSATGTGAYLSIEFALENGSMAWGDTLVIESTAPTVFKSGTNGRCTPTLSGGSGDYTIQAATGVTVTIDVPAATSLGVFSFLDNVGTNRFVFKNLNFTNSTSKTSVVLFRASSTVGPFLFRSENVTIDWNNTVSSGLPLFSTAAATNDINIEMYRTKISNSPNGIWSNTKVAGNPLTVNMQSCLLVNSSRLQYDSGTTPLLNLVMYNNTIANPMEVIFVDVSGVTNTVDIRNNIFVMDDAQNLMFSFPANVVAAFHATPSLFTFKNNVVFNTELVNFSSFDNLGVSAGQAEILPLDETNHFINPNFVSASTDFHISAGSVSYLSGRGDVSVVPTLDLDGNAYKGADIGCYTNPSSTVNTPALQKKVAFVGDSIMAGTVTFNQYTPPAGWAQVRNTPAAEWTPSESRAAIGGLKVQGVKWLIDRVMTVEQPKIVYLSVGVNNGSPYIGSGVSPTNMTTQQYIDALVVIMKKIQRWGATPIWLGREAQAGNNLALQTQLADEVNALMETACTTNGWRHGSILDYMKAKNANWNTVYYDDIVTDVHPNEAGHAVIAELALSLHPKQSSSSGFSLGNFNLSY